MHRKRKIFFCLFIFTIFNLSFFNLINSVFPAKFLFKSSQTNISRRLKDNSTQVALQARITQGLSNYPLILKKEDPGLWEKIKQAKIPIPSPVDGTIYVWSTKQLREVMQKAYKADYSDGLKGFERKDEKGNVVMTGDEHMPPIIVIGEDGLPKGIWQNTVEPGKRFIYGLNFRKDRQRQWVQAVLDPAFTKFDTRDLKGINVVGMTRYIKQMQEEDYVLADTVVKNGFVEWLNTEGKGKKVSWVFSREKQPFIQAMRGGMEEPFSNEDLDYRSISMPRAKKVKGGKTFYNQIPNQDYWKYPGLSMHFVAKAVAEKIRNSPGDNLAVTNLDAADLNCHEASQHLDETTTLWVEDKDFKEITFEGAEFQEKLNMLKSIGIKESRKSEGKDIEVDILEEAAKNRTVEVIVGEEDLIASLGLSKYFQEDEKAFFEVNFVTNTITVFKLVPQKGKGVESAYETLIALDRAVKTILEALREKNGVAIITADHGSLDDISKPGHTASDVPLFAIDFRDGQMQIIPLQKQNGTQDDAMVTMLHLLGIKKPAEMTGESILPEDYKPIPNRPAVFLIADGYAFGEDPDSEWNITARARKEGKTPTFADLFAKLPYVRVISAGEKAGLRGGKERDFPQADLLKREDVIARIKSMPDIKAIELINYDYDQHETYDYQKGLSELENSPFLNDRHFVLKINGKDKVTIKYFDYNQYGSTDYNLWTFGAGRIVIQPIKRLDQQFIEGTAFQTEAIQNALHLAKEQGFWEVTGILQEEGVHASLRQLYYLIQYFKQNGINKFVFHLASDGRDEDATRGINRFEELEKALVYLGIPETDYVINNVGGREDVFDRAQNWNITRGFLNILLYGSRIKPIVFNP